MAWPEDVLAAFRDLVASPAGENGLPGGSVADVATNIWRLRNRMSALPDGMRSTARHCEMAWDALAEAGVEIRDHLNDRVTRARTNTRDRGRAGSSGMEASLP